MCELKYHSLGYLAKVGQNETQKWKFESKHLVWWIYLSSKIETPNYRIEGMVLRMDKLTSEP